MLQLTEPAIENGFHAHIAALIQKTYCEKTSKEIIISPDMREIGRLLYEAPFALLAHDASDDPVFFYANLMAQALFEMSWSEITKLPSRWSAESSNQEERERLLHQVSLKGYIDNYSGVRISRTGRRFLIKGATVWNLTNEDDILIGQAAIFRDITHL
jgi:hypothetical protein